MKKLNSKVPKIPLTFRSGLLVVVLFFVISCVKNESFIEPYSVPDTYDFENKDSSATARLIMMYGLRNYLRMGADAQIDTAIVDSLWLNRGRPFTAALVPDFIYADSNLNKMTISLITGTTNTDTMMAFADSAALNSQFFNRAAGDGIAGTMTVAQPVSEKKLFSKDGVVFDEVWFAAMLGSMAMNNAFTQLGATGTTMAQAWNLAFAYTGLPTNYDPSTNYNAQPAPRVRPLGISAYFGNEAKAAGTGPEIFEEFRRGRSAVGVGDSRVSNASLTSLRFNIEKTLAAAAVFYLNAARQYTDLASRLNAISKAYGLMIGLKQEAASSTLTDEAYWQIREVFNERFYVLAQDASQAQLNEVISLLSEAYDL
ncbi:DUF4856 domain-containing protein [Niabella insulamsoli]|uniref:DUF4856 domain-containing protein n=1 Tax=Niabella insulamsoli TaxID=3144874 RepID=UPI0031FDF526